MSNKSGPCPKCGTEMVYEDETACGQRCQECQIGVVPYKWTVEIEIDPVWVADGFNLTAARLEDMIASVLGYASPDEYQGTIIKAPDPKQIRAEQGYEESGYTPRYTE